jgi:hypothetical protein
MRVLRLQEEYVQNSANLVYKLAYERGKKFWTDFYEPDLFHQIIRYLRAGKAVDALNVLGVMVRYYPQGFASGFEYLQRLMQRVVRGVVRSPIKEAVES